jgi:hypothetical protein
MRHSRHQQQRLAALVLLQSSHSVLLLQQGTGQGCRVWASLAPPL